MNARAISPALAILLLVTTLPAPPSAQAQAGTPASPPAGATGAPSPSAARPAQPAAASPGQRPQVGIADEKFFTENWQAAVEGIQVYDGIYDNPAELARVNRVGYELVQQADYFKYPITFTLINMVEPNAFGLPTGQIFISRGILDLGLDDDMLANLLGHEITHVIKEHYLHRSRRAMLMSILGNLLVAGVLISSAKNPPKQGVEGPYDPRVGYDPGGGNRVQGAAAASLIFSELLLRSFSRDQEDEADLVGQQLAAAAGYDPDGARRLWIAMENAAPQIREYGYLQTHPFSQERMRAAEARKGSWSIQKHQSADLFRQRSQDVLVAYAARQRVKDAMAPKKRQAPQPDDNGKREGLEPPKPPMAISDFVFQAALATWPRGGTADTLRLARLRRLRDTKLASCPDPSLFARGSAADHPEPAPPGNPGGRGPGGRHPQGGGQPSFRVARLPGFEAGACAPELHDYGAVVRAYRSELAEVQSLDPTGPTPPLIATLSGEIADLEAQRKALYPHAVEVFNGGIFETPFLVAFISNFPEAPEVPQVALALGDAYSRTGNETEAVSQYLTAWKAAPESSSGKRARAGLRNLTGSLKQLAALQELANQDQDPEIKRMAGERLATVAHSYDDVANGAEYLRRYPEGGYVVPVLDRLNVLADNLYGEVVLYQGFGDPAKASERINKILTNAPLSPAAEKLRDRAVLLAEKNG